MRREKTGTSRVFREPKVAKAAMPPLGEAALLAGSLDAIERMSEIEAFEKFVSIRYRDNFGKPECQFCGGDNLHFRGPVRRTWLCRDCRRDTSATTGTSFQSTKLGFKGILKTIVALANGSPSQAARDLGCDAGRTIRNAGRIRKENLAPTLAQKPFEIGKRRYMGGGYLSTRTWWTDAEKAALTEFSRQAFKIEAVAETLGRTPKSVVYYARELQLHVPGEWKLVLPPRKARSRICSGTDLLQYPYIARPTDANALVREVNDLVPRSFAPEVRADICQEALLSILMGERTVEDLRKNKDQMAWFVRKFYNQNHEAGGRAVSLTAAGEDNRTEDEIASAARADWLYSEMNDRRSAHDAMSERFAYPTQVEDVFQRQISDRQWQLHKRGLFYSRSETRAQLNESEPSPSPAPMKDDDLHIMRRARERYGVRLSRKDLGEMCDSIRRGRAVKYFSEQQGADNYFVTTHGIVIAVCFSWAQVQILTVYPPTDWIKEKAREHGLLVTGRDSGDLDGATFRSSAAMRAAPERFPRAQVFVAPGETT